MCINICGWVGPSKHIIPYTSNHPTQHKFAAVRFLYNRLNSYQLQPAEYRREENTIHNILHNNSFPILPQKTIPKNPPHPQRNPATQSWAVFTYTGKETTYITKLFRHTNIKIAYRTNNNLLRHLTPNPQPLDPLTRSGVYRLSCPDCSKAYIGQTGRDFRTRYNEHKRALQYNPHTSKYALHAATQQHTFGNIQEHMQILHTHNKGAHLNTIEKFYIFKEASTSNHLNDHHTVPNSKIFLTILNDFREENH